MENNKEKNVKMNAEKKAEKSEKVYKQSPVAICCYVIAAALLIYACYMAGSTVSQIKEYYNGYGMSPSAKEYFTYVLQAMIDPLVRAVLIFMAGYVLTAVRMLDPKNYGEKKQAKSSAASAIGAKTEDLKGDVAEAKAKVAFKIDDVKDKTADKLDDVKEEVADKLKDAKEAAADKIEDAKEDVAELKEKAGAKKNGAKKETRTTAKKAKAKAEEIKEEAEEKTEK